jgi:hypothetical protein
VPAGLLEPRLYRAAFAPALFALIVLMFSLQDVPRGLTPELAPPTFSASRALATADQLTTNYGQREIGSIADRRSAQLVAARFADSGFAVSSYPFEAGTVHGDRTLVNVLGVRPGPTDRRLVIAASRTGAPGRFEQVGAAETGVLLELARVIQTRNFGHTLVMASVPGDVGAAELARKLRRPVDGVVIIRNVASDSVDAPVLETYNSRLRPDPRFARTIERIAGIELRRGSHSRSTSAQLVRIGFPIALGEQATFPERGLSAVSLSPGGEPLVQPDWSRVSAVAAAGRIVLRALTTFDEGYRPQPPATAPLELGGKLIPGWALTIFIGALMLPLVVVSVDGWARARRWHESSARGLAAPPLALAWLLLLALLLRGLDLAGIVDAPPLPVDHALTSATGPVVIGLILFLLAAVGVLVVAAAARQVTAKGGESGFALWLVFSGLLVFAVSPVAAGFIVVLLHFLVVMLLTGVRPGRVQIWSLAIVGLIPLFAVVLYYTTAFGLTPFGMVRFAVELMAGGFVGILAALGICATFAAVGTSLLHLHWTAPSRRTASTVRPSILR